MIAQQIPSLNLVPEFVMPDDEQAGKQIVLNTSEWVVLSKIDGKRSLRDVAKVANLSEFHTCRLLYTLISNGLIRLHPPGT